MGIEIETTLLIDSSRPEAVLEKLATLDTLGDYRILPKGSCIIRDRYFDTADRSFMKRGFALRIRQTGPSFLLCLKGCERINEWGGVERLEIEETWNRKNLDSILRTLDESPLFAADISFDNDDPVKTLTDHGLRIIQDRQTDRIIRAVTELQGTSLRSCAEMSIDTVCYRFACRRFKHFEVEIEGQEPESVQHIETITTLLKSAFPKELKQWNHNKLITGYAIEALLDRGEVLSGIHDREAIDHTGYELIHAFIGHLRL